MTKTWQGRFIKPAEGAEKYLYAGPAMGLGVVVDDMGDTMVVAPVAHEFNTAEILLAKLLGRIPEPYIGMFTAVKKEHMRIATDEEVMDYADDVAEWEASPTAAVREGAKIVITDEFPESLPLTPGKAYEIHRDDERSYHIITDDGAKVNSVFYLFKYEIAEEEN